MCDRFGTRAASWHSRFRTLSRCIPDFISPRTSSSPARETRIPVISDTPEARIRSINQQMLCH